MCACLNVFVCVVSDLLCGDNGVLFIAMCVFVCMCV